MAAEIQKLLILGGKCDRSLTPDRAPVIDGAAYRGLSRRSAGSRIMECFASRVWRSLQSHVSQRRPTAQGFRCIPSTSPQKCLKIISAGWRCKGYTTRFTSQTGSPSVPRRKTSFLRNRSSLPSMTAIAACGIRLSLLQKYGFKGTLFLVTDQIGATNVWDLPLGVSEQPLMTREESALLGRQWDRDRIALPFTS